MNAVDVVSMSDSEVEALQSAINARSQVVKMLDHGGPYRGFIWLMFQGRSRHNLPTIQTMKYLRFIWAGLHDGEYPSLYATKLAVDTMRDEMFGVYESLS
jgi:hypothetical protein